MIRDLHRRRGRERRGLALAEGVRLVEEVLAAKVPCRAALTSPALEATDRGRSLKRSLEARGVAVTTAADDELAKLAATEHPQGVLAVIAPKSWTLADLAVSQTSVVVILDAIQDPGNVGAICRTALALGAAGVVALPGTAELTNPKTLRSSMGAMFRLPVVSADETEVEDWLRRSGITTAATAADGQPFDRLALPRPLALVLGNEGSGLTSGLGRNATLRLAIPLAGAAESLNVAVAAGIFLHGVCRDR
jgi:TrmH family RNA methyltransferase